MFKGHLICPFLILSRVSPECICVVSAQNTPQLIYYNYLKMSFLGPVLKRAVLVCTTLNVNELHIPALPLDEGVTCRPMAVVYLWLNEIQLFCMSFSLTCLFWNI